jgi:pimeloyl-ACP methyl ester carboxylesterase
MFKKTLISLAVASSLGLTGCLSGGDTGANANPEYKITDTTIDRSLVRPVYNPSPLAEDVQLPINADLILLLGASQGANYDFTGLSTGNTPADAAVNELSGFSTSGAFTLKFDGELNPSSVMASASVFVVPLNVGPAIDSAPEALPNTNPGGIDSTNPFDAANIPNFRADVVNIDGGVNNAIRIVPLEPLAEGQKYIVIVSDRVQGANGKPIARAVQDEQLADGVLGNDALASVKSLLQTMDTLGNAFLASVDPGAESALSYSFTTNADTKVLKTMMDPLQSTTGLGQKIGFTAQLKAIRDNYPDLTFSELTDKLSEIGELAVALGGGQISPSDLSDQELAAINDLQSATAATTPSAIQTAITGEIGKTIHLPVPRPSFFFPETDAEDLTTIQGLGGSNPIAQAAQTVQVHQGAIALPYFQSLPGSDGSGIVKGSWYGSTSLEANLNESLTPGDTIFSFLRDLGGTKLNVNGYFPFPQKRATTTVPIVVFTPATDVRPSSCVDANKPNGVTIFQHGITVDRSVSMLPAILLANGACQAVVAIDQPLHGLSGPGTGTVPGLTPLDETALTNAVNSTITALGGSSPALEASLNALINADYIGERHFGYTADANLNPVSAPLSEIKSGSLFINPLNMQNSRDNLRQAVVDLLNLAATIQTLDIDGDYTTQGDLAGIPVNFVGHSLGGISGTTFASLMNDPTLTAELNAIYPTGFSFPTLSSVVLHNTSGQVTRLIENSPAFSSVILDGLAAKGVTQKTSDFENFFYVFQSVADAGDPVNFAEGLGASTSNILVTEVTGDNTVPNEANINPLGQAYSAPLTGTEPLMALIDIGAGGSMLSDGSEGLGIIDTSNTASETMPVATFFDGTNPCSDANHGTFVAPIAPNDNCPGGAADTSVAFDAMVKQTAQALSGLTIPGGNQPSIGASLGASLTIESALDQDVPAP